MVEWIDAEEEEDSYIAGSAYMAPQKCDHCGKLLSETDVDWRNPGEEGKVTKWAVPDLYVLVDEIPKTSVGKLDKKILRAQHGTA